jgi:hypothetical protein
MVKKLETFKGIIDQGRSIEMISADLGKHLGLSVTPKKGFILANRTPIDRITTDNLAELSARNR